MIMTAALDIPALLATLPARISDIPRRRARETPAAPAIVEAGLCWSYAELEAAIDDAAVMLREHGVRPGDRVMIVGENCALTVALIFAAAALDAWSMHVNARLSPREIETIREHAKPRRVLYTHAISKDAAAHAVQAGAVETSAGRAGTLMLGPLDSAATAEIAHCAAAEQVAALIYTSGTTGHPKGVMLTHRNLLFIAAVSSHLRALSPTDRVYAVLPFSHVYGLASVMIGSLYAGCCLHVVSGYVPERLAHALEFDGISVFQGVPAMYARLLDYLRGGRKLVAPALRFIYAGGSPLDPTLKADVEAMFGRPLHNGYGMTESAPTISQTRFDAPRADTSVGPVIPGVEAQVRDMSGANLPDGESGELWVRGPNVMKGYYLEPELTAQVVDADGWLNTGDLVRRDADGALHIVGRTKDLIIRSGFNVYPVEVEAVLNTHPVVLQSAVVGRMVGDGNEEVIAFVECAPGMCVGESELLTYASNRLSPYKRPARVVIVEALPAAATGKVLKQSLRETARGLAATEAVAIAHERKP